MNKININKKSIIILFLIILLCIIVVFISMSKKEKDNFVVSESDEIQGISNKNDTENKKQENNENDYIFVHIIGEIKNPGIVEIHER